MAPRDLPAKALAPRIAILGSLLLLAGLGLALVISTHTSAFNERDLPLNTWFFALGQNHPIVNFAADSVSWCADGARNIIIVPLVSIILFSLRQWPWAVFLIVSSQGGLLISNALKFSVARQRPSILESTNFQLHLSFPSGHTFSGLTVWICMALIAWYLIPRPMSTIAAIVLAVIGLANGPSRLIVGKHWLTDVLGAWIIGAGWLLIVWAGFIWFLSPKVARDRL